MDIGKIYIRSLIGIVTAGTVTVLLNVQDPNILLAMYGAIGFMVYVDRDVSGEIPTK